MSKRSEIEKQIAALQAELDGADTDDEVWIKDGDHEFKVTGKRATTLLGRYAKLWETADEGGADEGGEEEAEEDPKPSGGYFARGKK